MARHSRHLHFAASDARAICGRWGGERIHYTKAKRTDCPECRKLARAEITRHRAQQMRKAAASTECEDVARRLIRQADRLDPRGAVVELSARRPLSGVPERPRELPDDLAAWWWVLSQAAYQLTKRGVLLCDLEAAVQRAFWDQGPPRLPAVPQESKR